LLELFLLDLLSYVPRVNSSGTTSLQLGTKVFNLFRGYRKQQHSARSTHRHYPTYEPNHFSAASSPEWLDSNIASQSSCLNNVITSMTRQHYRQYDSAVTSRHSHVTLAAPSPAWLDSTIASMTQQWHCATVKSPRYCHYQHDSIALSPAWLNSNIASRSMSPRQHHHQHDLVATSCHG
jgi:hypothetical protein